MGMNAKWYAYKRCFNVIELIILHFLGVEVFLKTSKETFFFQKFSKEKLSFLLLAVKVQLAQEFKPIFHLHLPVFQIPNHLCANLQTWLIPPRSESTNLSV